MDFLPYNQENSNFYILDSKPIKSIIIDIQENTDEKIQENTLKVPRQRKWVIVIQ